MFQPRHEYQIHAHARNIRHALTEFQCILDQQFTGRQKLVAVRMQEIRPTVTPRHLMNDLNLSIDQTDGLMIGMHVAGDLGQ